MTVFSEHCILALQAATAAACVEALNATPPGELWSHVLSVVHPVIQVQARKHMARTSCIDRLPNELLLAVFERLGIWDRVRTATVCHRWRKVSLNAVSALWTDLPHLYKVDNYEHLLSRARYIPVTLTYRPEDLEDLESFCDTLSRNLDRIKSLVLVLPDPDDDEESLDAAQHLNGILCGNAPFLEYLVLAGHGDIFGRVSSSVPLLKSPMLRTIELDGFHLSALEACVDSSAVRALRVATADTYYKINQKDWSYLSRLPAVEALSLHLLDVFVIDIPAHSPPLPQSVRHLSLQAHPQFLDALAKLDDLSRFRTLHITFLHDYADVSQVADLLPSLSGTTVSAAVHFGAEYFCLLAADQSGRKRVFRHIKLDDDWHTLVPNVTRLWLDVYDAKSQRPATLAEFPGLEELTLDATSTSPFEFAARGPSPLVWPSLSCPRLRDVRYLSENARASLSTGEVLNYLRSALEIRSPPLRRLQSLVFDGITLTSEPNLNRSAVLGAVAENVRMKQSGVVPQESYRAWALLIPCGQRSHL